MLPSIDDRFARKRMRDLAQLSGSDLPRARKVAQTVAHTWVFEGQSTVYESWFLPILVAEGEEGALSVASNNYNLPYMSLEDAYQHPDWQEFFRRQISVQRAWGVPGLCWALLREHLERSGAFRYCKLCWRPLHGRSDKRSCRRADNEDCFRQQMRERKQKERRR